MLAGAHRQLPHTCQLPLLIRASAAALPATGQLLCRRPAEPDSNSAQSPTLMIWRPFCPCNAFHFKVLQCHDSAGVNDHAARQRLPQKQQHIHAVISLQQSTVEQEHDVLNFECLSTTIAAVDSLAPAVLQHHHCYAFTVGNKCAGQVHLEAAAV